MRRHDRLDMGKRRCRMTDFKWFFENAGPRFEAGQYFGEDRERAVGGRDRAADRLTPDQLAEAQRLAREWDAAYPREP